MKTRGVVFFSALLVVALFLICASASGSIPVPLPWCALVGLGVPAIILLWYHRRKLSELI